LGFLSQLLTFVVILQQPHLVRAIFRWRKMAKAMVVMWHIAFAI